MSTVKQIPANTKIYSTLARCCKYQSVLPSYVQSVFDSKTKKPTGFSALPEKVEGAYIYWTN